MRDAIRVVLLVKGDGRLGPPEPRRCGEGVDGVHLPIGDATLPVGFICLGAPKDHKAALDLGELVVFLLGVVYQVVGLQGRLLGRALLAKGAKDVALHGSTVLEKMLRLPHVERARGLEHLLKVFWACSVPAGLRSCSAVDHGDHFLPMAILLLVPPVAVLLGLGKIISAIATTEVASGLAFPIEVGLDGLLASGILGGDVKHEDKCLVGRAADEGMDRVSIDDVWELIAPLGEALNVLLEGLVGLLPVVVEVLGVS
jgi:hypothetical protein